ncbi:rhodanese-like domain-containing protein [Mesorhizobium sp. KR9-304]|uniref:rhodanese-like domain-containing protein n=1 Tax=Mesorhizobium sp. KR9-304 TaxID=3156614 RepID=UPI0032B44708
MMTVDDMLFEARAMLAIRVAPTEAYDEMERGALLVDIRYLEQRVRDGEIPRAVHIARNEFEWRCDPSSAWRHRMIRKGDYERRIIVICNQGYQSSFAAANLVRMGLRNATDVEGGMENWLQNGLPIRPFEHNKLRKLLHVTAAQIANPQSRPIHGRPR